MRALSSDMEAKAAVAVLALGTQPALAAEVETEVAGFFARHPGLERTPLTEAFITSLVLERLSTPADSPPAAQPKPDTKKVA